METTASSELAYRGGNFINGEERPSLAGGTFFSYDPLTGRPWGQFALADRDDVDLALRSGQAAFDGEWQRMSPATRGRALIRWGELILEHKDRLASLDSAQNGKLLPEVRAQARSARDCLFFFGGLVDKIQGAVIPLETSSVLNYTLYEPLGVVATIVPWNGPIFLTIMSVSPALAAGNSVLIKPSEVSSASAVELAKLAIEAGMPAGAVNVVTGDRTTGEAVVEHPFVRKIIFTGGDAAGRAIAARAGERLIGVTLELGGKSPNIVFADAPFEKAVAGILGGIFAGAGQGCIAGSRIYIQNSFYEEFLGRLIERCAAIRLGSALEPGTQVGPIATVAQLKKIDEMVGRAVADGANLRCGGARAAIPAYPEGNFYQPTILDGCKPDSEIVQEEVFGPVAVVSSFETLEEAVALANASRFGLAAGIWTSSLRTAHLCAKQVRAGTVWVNTYRAIASQSPFGGMKDSGYGRQNGIDAVFQYLQSKSVWCELSEDISDPFIMKL